jgi:hypothetical protein
MDALDEAHETGDVCRYWRYVQACQTKKAESLNAPGL